MHDKEITPAIAFVRKSIKASQNKLKYAPIIDRLVFRDFEI